MFVFKDLDDHIKNGKNADAEFNASDVKVVKKTSGKRGQKIRHKKFGAGTLVKKTGDFPVVNFRGWVKKQLNLQVCLDNELI